MNATQIAHTPGPWVVPPDSDGFSIETVDGRIIAQAMQVSPPTNPFRHQERRANARLIAAAPDLLNTLRELVEIADAAISAGDWKVDGCCDPSLSLDWARAAIAKVTGEAP
jgi:hypothetical protein